MIDHSVRSRARGTLLGLACGDALGRPVEFRTSAGIESEHGRVTEMLGHGTHDRPPGTITDDTEMALCIARSLVERGGFDGADVARRFVGWYESGPFDIGLMTADSLAQVREGVAWTDAGRKAWEGRTEGSNAGNGSVMRCAPYALAYLDRPGVLAEVSRASSEITHADPRCTAGCALLNEVVRRLVCGESDPDSVVGDALTLVDGSGAVPDELWTRVAGLPEETDTETLGYSGYVLATLESGLYHGLSADSFEEAVVEAVNHGDDADTVGAVTGAVAGARFGLDAVPERWRDELAERGELRRLADELLELAPAED
ncbi:ADP-ribosylglycohydrolase family protein [Halopelagius fulvigenes]|uniref:ADP-ribosylglycohydrolase family protein n=1 Tax=Halopelagius fulvigenes TaxID=1198324 RepID=A0ABD5U3Z7_9EURY